MKYKQFEYYNKIVNQESFIFGWEALFRFNKLINF